MTKTKEEYIEKYHSVYTCILEKTGFSLQEGGVILEVGSRDALDAIKMSKTFDKKVYAFECHPQGQILMDFNLDKFEILKDQVEVVPVAVSDVNGPISFYPTEKKENAGSSSIFKLKKAAQAEKLLQSGESLTTTARALNIKPNVVRHTKATGPQYEIQVESIRLSTWIEQTQMNEKISLIAMDLQGAELRALKGLGDYINRVNCIITEGQYSQLYEDCPLIHETVEYLSSFGFKLQYSTHGYPKSDRPAWGDFMFTK
jgi:FkbM family methyltransferase